MLALGYSLEFGSCDAFIDEFFIMEEYRRKGIGKAVLAQAQKVAKRRQIKALHLEVTRHNDRVTGFYSKGGFVDHDRRLMTRRT